MLAEHIRPLLAVLERRDDIPEPERQALAALPWRLRQFSVETEIVAAGDSPDESCFIVAGYAARAVQLSSGIRQLTSLHVPGDFVDFHALLLRRMDHSVVAMTQCTMAFVRHPALRGISDEFPHLWRLLSLTSAIDAAIQRHWIASLGRRRATQRLAHLLCEVCLRLEVVGAVRDGSFEMPINQVRLADLLGLSIVHTNRALQELRGAGLLSWSRGVVSIRDWHGLARLAEFDEGYLNLLHEPR